MKYKASLDTMAKAISFLFVMIAVLMLFFPKLISIDNQRLNELFFISPILIIVTIICFILKPSYYILEDETIIIHRIFKDVKILRSDILKVELVPAEKLKWSIRTFGVGGLFGYFGKFYNRNIGSMTWYATQRKNFVLIKTSKKNIIITPDEAENFVESYNRK
jgi:hypothetical protein